MRDEEKRFTHESYGLAGLYRVEGTVGALFGSHLDKHHTTMHLRIFHAERRHDLARDWFGTDSRRPIVEIVFSAAQFAEFVTTPNMGDGVPCTIRSIEGRAMAAPPKVETEAQATQAAVDEKFTALARKLNAMLGECRDALADAKVPQKRQDAILGPIASLVQEMTLNIPWIAGQLRESMAKTVSAAKSEVEAALVHMIHKAGIEHLRGLPASEITTPALPEKGE
jgi:hypothetical protein